MRKVVANCDVCLRLAEPGELLEFAVANGTVDLCRSCSTVLSSPKDKKHPAITTALGHAVWALLTKDVAPVKA